MMPKSLLLLFALLTFIALLLAAMLFAKQPEFTLSPKLEERSAFDLNMVVERNLPECFMPPLLTAKQQEALNQHERKSQRTVTAKSNEPQERVIGGRGFCGYEYELKRQLKYPVLELQQMFEQNH